MKCKYLKKCGEYDPFSEVCNHSGDYYSIGRKAGCYRALEEKEKRNE